MYHEETSFVDHYYCLCSPSTSYSSGIIPDIAIADEGAAQFIKERLKFGSIEEKRLRLNTALASIDALVCDPYRNFMLQGLFESGIAEMKEELMDAIYGQDVVALCLHMHG